MSIIAHDARINFDSVKFYVEAKILDIMYYQIFVETYWWILKVEKYHRSVCSAYDINQTGIQGIMSKNPMVPMAFKNVHNTVKFDDLISTPLIFSVYVCILINSPSSHL